MKLTQRGMLLFLLGYPFVGFPFQKNNQLAFKPLFPATPFNKLLTECMELWADVRNFIKKEDGGCYDCVLQKMVQLYSMLFAFKNSDRKKIHPGNFEYLLSVCDKIYYESNSIFLQAMMQQIKREIIKLL